MKSFKKVVLSLSLFLLIGIVLVGCKNKDSIILKDVKETLDIQYIEGEHIVLPSEVGEVSISWKSSHPHVISHEGKVFPKEEDTLVTLTATITHKKEIDEKHFQFNVKARVITDAEKVLQAKNALVLANEIADETDINLVSKGLFNSTISWSSSHEEIINSENGSVILPEDDTTVTLTATIKIGAVEETKQFEILVKTYNVEEKIIETLEKIILVPEFESGYQEEDFNAVKVAKVRGNDVVVTWTSSNEKVMLADGSLVDFYNSEEQTVTLTASITFKGITKEATTKVMVVKGIKLTISEIKNLKTKIEVKFAGVVTGVDRERVIVEDNTGAIYVNLVEVNEDVLVGDSLTIIGKTQVLYSMFQISGATMTIESSGNEISPGLTSYAGLTEENLGFHITINNLTVVNGSKAMIVVTDGTTEITVYGSNKNPDVIDKMAPIREGTIINLKRAHIGINSAKDISIYVFDISEITFDLTNEEMVTRSIQALELPEVKVDLEPLEVPRYGKYGAQIIWTSSDNDVINPETGEISLPDYDITVTMKAKVFMGDVEQTKTFYVLVKKTLVGLKTLEKDTDIEFIGIVTGIEGNTIIVNDHYAAMFVSATAIPAGIMIGDEVSVMGKIFIGNNVIRVDQATVEILSTDQPLPEKLTSLKDIKLSNMGERFKIENLQVSSYDNKGKFNVTDGTNEITLWYVGNDQSIKDHLSSIRENTLIDLTGVHLLYKSAIEHYLLILNKDEVVIKLTDLEKANLDLEKIILPETIDANGMLALPDTGIYGSTIIWDSSNEDVINPATGEVLVPIITETITLRATIKFGLSEEVVSKLFQIECLGKPRTFKAKYTGTTNATMENPGNNADKIGLDPLIFTVKSNSLEVAPRKYLGVALSSEGKIVLGELNGQGHNLEISVGLDYKITEIKINFASTSTSTTIVIGNLPPQTNPFSNNYEAVYQNLNVNKFAIENSGTNNLEIRSITITVAAK